MNSTAQQHAINLHVYAKPDKDKGCALWHLYHERDSRGLREFLYQHQATQRQVPLEQLKRKSDDPLYTY
ncbi:hypothetical protein MJO28_010623 [Puccinia striiformis f. sp. tritici]|uniref:Uncharacterized protein n=1 Tax=Puccinia striiformis f. sp. tritici TaxID=168172 RepID=A0ACC0E6Z7_9BASI|nr:hypothetical protein MJO28_010623 [Puccinia striiformis f. sp. tritici]